MRRRLLIGAGAPLFLFAVVALTLTQPVPRSAREGPEVKVDVERLKASVQKLAVEFAPRDFKNAKNLDAAALWIQSELSQDTKDVRVAHWQVAGADYQNISAFFGPLEGPRVVLGAHYDGCEPFPAADDNASGVAALLEVARLLAEHPPLKPVELVAWSLEEPPFFRTESMGSFVHAKALSAAGVKVRAAISLESIGYFRDDEGSQHFPVPGLGLLYSTRADYLAVVGNLGQVGLTREVKSAMRAAAPLSIFSINAPVAIPGIDFSDHLNYWRFGYPAVMVTDTAFNRNSNYHAKSDLPETLDYPRLAQATAGAYEVVWRLSH